MLEMPKKKVLIVITKSNFGGAQRYVYDIATSLPKESFEVVVVFGEGGELEEKLHVAGVRTIKIDALQRNVSLLKDFAVYFELVRIFKKEKPDVVHLNSTKIGGIGAVAGRVCKIPKIIFTAHGWAFNEKRNIVSKAVITFLQWATVMLCHTTIAVSQKTANQITVFPFINKNKIKIIYNGTAEIDFVEREEARRALLGEQVSTTWIGTISELHTNKGLDVALEAFSKISQKYPEAIYVIIGGGEEKNNLTTKIYELGLTDRVFLLGFVADAKKYLKAFDIFTLTSRTEALPYVILEAGLAELPVIASNVGGIPEIINSSNVGLLVPTEKTQKSNEVTQTISGALEKIITQPEYAKTLGQNLKRRVTSEFSYEKMHTETFDLYK